MDPQPSPWRTATVHLATHGQTHEKINAIVASILNRGGCLTCGRMINIAVEFAVDPPPEFQQHGAISVTAAGAE